MYLKQLWLFFCIKWGRRFTSTAASFYTKWGFKNVEVARASKALLHTQPFRLARANLSTSTPPAGRHYTFPFPSYHRTPSILDCTSPLPFTQLSTAVVTDNKKWHKLVILHVSAGVGYVLHQVELCFTSSGVSHFGFFEQKKWFWMHSILRNRVNLQILANWFSQMTWKIPLRADIYQCRCTLISPRWLWISGVQH